MPALYPQLHAAFRESANYSSVTSTAYEKSYVWPLNWLLAYKIRNNVTSALEGKLRGMSSKEVQALTRFLFAQVSVGCGSSEASG